MRLFTLVNLRTLLVFLVTPIQAVAIGPTRSEANWNTECPLLNGVYSYYSEELGDVLGTKVGFNSLIRRASVFGNVEGVVLSHQPDQSLLLVKVRGTNLSSAIEPSLLKRVVRYQLALTCESGKWVYRTNISGSSDGTPVESDEVFYFFLDANGDLIVRNESKGAARLGGLLRQAWQVTGTSKFLRLNQSN